jgi:undecaprenyl diphosphate synthase
MSLKHLAIILDGNGRWANYHSLHKSEGHKKGAENAKKMVELASKKGIKHLSLFCFSSENWRRSDEEVNDLMSLLSFYLTERIDELSKNNICLKIIGDKRKLNKEHQESIERAEKITKDNDSLFLYLAISYGGKDEIVRATKKIIENNIDPKEVTEELITKNLDVPDMPDVDLLIRTSGEKRISNFLIWQIAYSELYFTDVLWPDFDESELNKAIDFFNNRKRNFGYARNQNQQ